MNFHKILTDWYSIHKRDLPWRKTKNPYHIWLSEIILQQTQIKQGLPYYENFIINFPSVFDLAKAKEETVLKLWQGLGYYSRARNLHYTAKHIVDEFNGVFPTSYKELLKLKGIGDYTASAIASICFEESTAVVDGNVYRLLSRYFGIETPINSTEGIKEFKNLAQQLLPKKNIGDYNQSLMEFGSRQCKPKNPNCNVCPLHKKCTALELNKIEMLPVKLKKLKITKKHFNFLVFISEDRRTILKQRIGKGIWQNLYQFPLVETNEDLKERDFSENKTIIKFLNKKPYTVALYNKKTIIHKLSHQHLYTKFWIIKVSKLPEKGVAISKLKTFPVPILISKFLEGFNF